MVFKLKMTDLDQQILKFKFKKSYEKDDYFVSKSNYFAFNLIDDGLVGQQVFAGEATRLAYMTEEAEEGKNAFLEKRTPNWKEFGRSPS